MHEIATEDNIVKRIGQNVYTYTEQDIKMQEAIYWKSLLGYGYLP